MKVRDLMTSDLRICRPETSLADAVRDMWEGDCRALPVVNDAGQVTGMITDRDICIALGTRGMLSLNDVVTHAGSAPSTEIVSTLASICEHRRPIPIGGAT